MPTPYTLGGSRLVSNNQSTRDGKNEKHREEDAAHPFPPASPSFQGSHTPREIEIRTGTNNMNHLSIVVME
ncbi:hypothetical protein VTH06DRAFT_5099 [Thermothelomyces fergusii]